MSGTVCCYSGCKKSYSTDKDVSFFKFPDEPKRRKKWMQNCGNMELENLSDRQLRGKRICSDHFVQGSFLRPESRAALNDSAVPIMTKGKKAPPVAPSTPQEVDSKKSDDPVITRSSGRRGKGMRGKRTTTEPEPDKDTNVGVTSQKSKGATPKSPVTKVKGSTGTAESVESTTEKDQTKTGVAITTPATPVKESTTDTISDSSSNTPNPSLSKVKNEPQTRRSGQGTTNIKRKKLMQNSGDSEVESPSDRQPRRKRICTDHVGESSILSPESSATTPKESVAPNVTKGKKTPSVATPTLQEVGSKKSDDSGVTRSSGRRGKGIGGKTATPEPEPVKDTNLVVASPKSKGATPKSPVTKVKGTTATAESVESTTEKEKIERNTKTAPSTDIPPTLVIVTAASPEVDSKKKDDSGITRFGGRKGKGVGGKTVVTEPEPDKGTNLGVTASQKGKGATPKSPTKAKSTIVTTESVASTTEKDHTKTVTAVETITAPVIETRREEEKTMDTITPVQSYPPIPLTAKVKIEPQQILPPPSIKKVSIEAMMAAVASTKAPVVPIVPPSFEKPPPILQLCGKSQPRKPKPTKQLIPSATTVEIVRQKPKDGNVTVVLVRQSETERLAKEPEPEAEAEEDNESEADSYDEYMYYDREFDFEQEEDGNKADREFERFHSSLKKFLHLPGKWTMGGVQWDPQGKRKVIIISEPEIPPSGRPCVKRCLQCFEDKSVRVFIDQMDMTDVFGMSCYSEKEDVAGLINRIADASSCCGVPEMVVDDLVHFPRVRKRNTSYFDENCPGVIPNDAYDPICTACKELQGLLVESREREKMRLLERRIRSEEKQFMHPFGEALYTLFNDLADETDPSKPKKKRTKETFFRKFLHDTRYKVTGDTARTERVYIEKPISVDSVSQSFQDIVSKLGFNMPNAKKRPSGGLLPRPTPSMSNTRLSNNRLFPGSSSSNVVKVERKLPIAMEHILPFTPGSSFTLDDGQEYELIGEVEPTPEFIEMKPTPASAAQQQQFEIIEVDDETLAQLASSKNQVVMLPDGSGTSISSLPVTSTTRIDANDPNLSQILKAINTSHLTRF